MVALCVAVGCSQALHELQLQLQLGLELGLVLELGLGLGEVQAMDQACRQGRHLPWFDVD